MNKDMKMTREMTTIDLIQLLRNSRTDRSSWLPMWEDLARGHYRDLRSRWMNTNNKTLAEWREFENSVQLLMWQGGNYAEDWLKFAYNLVMVK
jgi:hypothetical protein